ncbi:serine/threonine protein phosphatase [Fulvivirga sp. RKSG066]|uniref:metallophosphoesterase n=1 Tax=Fulvivirga aurantia TaxID=2529383 RepID=UPI0012BB899A|nr:metallophosphoesterase [Fulvivirga aurantia]MTI20112.1 serine/threonine protein phosphatase [Fulvivirga aurantia]
MRHFVIGDIHGAYRGLRQCLERSAFDYEKDQLICLGDVCDGWPETKASIDELLKIKHLVFILGNHDHWALQWARHGTKSHVWLSQGGRNTVASYNGEPMPETHKNLLEEAAYYYEWNNQLFVHAGIDPEEKPENQTEEIFLWDRAMAKAALDNHFSGGDQTFTDYEAVYIGHTPTHNYGILEPIQSGGVWLMDTGAGWDGVLSMMDLETKEVFASDKIDTLYPPGTGRIRI